jgi:hypothetical protein
VSLSLLEYLRRQNSTLTRTAVCFELLVEREQNGVSLQIKNKQIGGISIPNLLLKSGPLISVLKLLSTSFSFFPIYY